MSGPGERAVDVQSVQNTAEADSGSKKRRRSDIQFGSSEDEDNIQFFMQPKKKKRKIEAQAKQMATMMVPESNVPSVPVLRELLTLSQKVESEDSEDEMYVIVKKKDVGEEVIVLCTREVFAAAEECEPPLSPSSSYLPLALMTPSATASSLESTMDMTIYDDTNRMTPSATASSSMPSSLESTMDMNIYDDTNSPSFN